MDAIKTETVVDSDPDVTSVLREDLTCEEDQSMNNVTDEKYRDPSRGQTQPSMTLTNTTRGNTEKTSSVKLDETNIFQLAAQGELSLIADAPAGELTRSLDADQLTTLMWAAAYGQRDAVQLLLARGAEVDHRGRAGETALMLSMAAGHHRTGLLLLAAGCDVNICDELLNTALLYAVYNNHVSCVSLLLRWGADCTRTNIDGLTALTICVRLSHHIVQSVIDEHLKNCMMNAADGEMD